MSPDQPPARHPESLLPLSPATLHVLLVLATTELHGYGIMQEVAARTDGQLRIGPGTLYGTLKRLVADGLASEIEREDATDHERRRYYKLTAFGRAVAAAEARRLELVVQLARGARLLTPRLG